MFPAVDLDACLTTAWALPPEMALRLAVLVGLLLIAGWVAAQRYFPGQRAFIGLHVVMIGWITATTIERAALAPGCKVSLAILAWPMIMMVAPLWALFLYRFAHTAQRELPRALTATLGLPTLAMGLLSLANGVHGLLYGLGTRAVESPPGLVRMHYDYGPLFYAQALWGYGFLLFSTVLMLRALREADGADRRQWVGFLVISTVPWLTNVVYIAFGVRLYGADPTPLSFALAVVALAWLIRSNQLFKVVPLGRRVLFTELPDPVLILDASGHVVEANEAALALAPQRPERGKLLAQWPRIGAQIAARLADRQLGTLITLDAPTTIFEMRVRPIGNPEQPIGRLVQLRDITEHQQAQARIVHTLAERNAQLDTVAALQEELRELTLRDPLTGLYNRRALAQRFEREAAHRRVTGLPLALALIDIDHFKTLNDRFGHAAGDAALIALAGAFGRGLRAADTAYRMGGEEFALLLPGADAEQARARVDALRAQVGAAALGPHGGALEFSAGVAACAEGDCSLDGLLHDADAALYAAKRAGRNRVAVAPALP